MDQERQQILFIINPAAGANDKSNLLSALPNLANSLALDYRLYVMTGANDFNAIQHEMKVYVPNLLVAVGGDGTCNLVSQLALQHNITMGILPFGSANGMAAELNIPKELNASVHTLIHGQTKKIDLLIVNETDIAMHLSDVGLNAKIVKRFHLENKRGLWRYVVHFFTEIFLLQFYRFVITCDGKTFLRKAISVTFANASKYGTGAVINPKGLLDDGKFELCIIKPFPWYYIFPLTFQFFSGNLTSSKYVEIISCSEASISSIRKLILQVDGEIKKKVNKVVVRILPKALSIRVPNSNAV
jgi:diacylglycerol kinase (ATP)